MIRNNLTLRSLLQNYLDLFSVPRRSFFEICAHFSNDETHVEKLRYFTSAEGQEDLYAYCYRPKRTAFEILKDFHSIRIPVDYLIDIFPQIRPKSFSIANSWDAQKREIHLLVGIVEYKTVMKAPRTGVCTRWLSQLRLGSQGLQRRIVDDIVTCLSNTNDETRNISTSKLCGISHIYDRSW